VKVRVSVDTRGFTALINKTKRDVSEALEQGVREGGRIVTQYIKYDLLAGTGGKVVSGGIIVKRTGALQRGIYYTVRGKHQVVVQVRGERKQVAEWLEKGVSKTWLLPTIRVGTRGQWWPPVGKIQRREWRHPGIKAKEFMSKAASAKRAEVEKNIQRLVNSAIRS
jgi:hypothetical protein